MTMFSAAERSAASGYVEIIAAMDSMDVIAERIKRLFGHGRRVALTDRYVDSMFTAPRLHVGFELDAYRDGMAYSSSGDFRELMIYLRNRGRTETIGIGAAAGQHDSEAEQWRRYSQTSGDNLRDLTLVTFDGGQDGFGPGVEDSVLIQHWNTHGVLRERVIGFDTTLNWKS